MTGAGGRPRDVRRWPLDAQARQALTEYLEALAGTRPGGVRPTLDGVQVDFRGADLSGLDLSGACLIAAELSQVRALGCILAGADLRGATFTGADLTRADLTKIEAAECHADGAVCRSANLFGAELQRSSLVGADLRQVYANSVRLWEADLRGADLRGASLFDARFATSDAAGTLLDGARLAGSVVEQAQGSVSGTVDVEEELPSLLGGEELRAWFRDHGAPGVRVSGGA